MIMSIPRTSSLDFVAVLYRFSNFDFLSVGSSIDGCGEEAAERVAVIPGDEDAAELACRPRFRAMGTGL
jgi:hypothetical protein